MARTWYSLDTAAVISELNTSERGLSTDEAKKRLIERGPNALPKGYVPGYGVIFLQQFASPLVLVLILASIVVFLIGETADAIIILAVLFFNAIVGAIQEGKAQNTLRALQNFAVTNAIVLRDGTETILPDRELVPGDVLVLSAGEQVSADARLIYANNLQVMEAALTGESTSVDKINEALAGAELPVVDQRNMLFKGTFITAGAGEAVVVATGRETELGKISETIAQVETEIPLKRAIRRLSYVMVASVGVLSILIFIFGVAIGRSAEEMFTTTVALAVSVIPEGLPIVITLILAGGVWRMGQRHALVKKMQAVEALGQATVIAVDKTGTLTRNEMVVQKVFVADRFFAVSGDGYTPTGTIELVGSTVDPINHPELLLLGKVATFCAHARVAFEPDKTSWLVSGDPTEAALLVFGEKIGFHKAELEGECPEIDEIPFDHVRKYHTTLHRTGTKAFMTVVGAPENILHLADHWWTPTGTKELTKSKRTELESTIQDLSREGYRVLACAIRDNEPLESLEGVEVANLTFVGFFAMRDALRPEVHEAMERAALAGVTVVMITGDHQITAEAIAREAGIFKDGDLVLTGAELLALDERELVARLDRVRVFARVTPEHKMRIIQAYKARGETVAMTGDGVNDAPSLVAADLGVGMGKIGTEVAKEAADIILLDDNFGTIISAIEEGRNIYRSIKKALLYLISTSVGEVLAIVGALALDFPLPVLAAQIIWLNLVTDGFLTVAWAMEPPDRDLLRHYRPNRSGLIDRSMLLRIIIMGLPMMIGTLWLFSGYKDTNLTLGWSMSLTVLAVFQWFNAWNCRSDHESIFQARFFANRYLVGATALVILLQIAALYLPPLQKILHTTPLSWQEWLLVIAVAASIVVVEELRKLFVRISHRNSETAAVS